MRGKDNKRTRVKSNAKCRLSKEKVTMIIWGKITCVCMVKLDDDSRFESYTPSRNLNSIAFFIETRERENMTLKT